jgi:hypothetical protein
MKLAGERKAIASAVLALYAFFYLLVALNGTMPGMFFTMTGLYGSAFFVLVAGYFWARWYAMGVAISGVIIGALSIWQQGTEPVLLFVAGTHLLAALALSGSTMRAMFEGQEPWRKKLHMDEHAVVRLGRSVTRASVMLPFFLMYAFAPKQDVSTVLLVTAAATSGLGLVGLVNMRTWGLLALVATAGTMLTATLTSPSCQSCSVAGVGLLLCVAALAPMIAPLIRHLANRSA